MKKHYLTIEKYLWNESSPDGAAGSGSAPNASAVGPDDIDISGLGKEAPATPATPLQPSAAPSGDWKSALPEELRNNPRIQKASSIEEIVKIAANAPSIPEVIKVPKGVPESLGKWAKSQNMTQVQFDSVLKQYVNVEKARVEGLKKSNEAGLKQLFNKWGTDKKANTQLANRVLAFADPQGELKLADFLKGPVSGHAALNPLVVEAFFNLGKAFKEGKALNFSTPDSQGSKRKINPAHEMYPDQAPKS